MTQGLLIDYFAGGGGASVAIEDAFERPIDYALNHDEAAIQMHEANHPETIHLREDARRADPAIICAGRPVLHAHFSPDCRHFSRAKGGVPVKKEIRGLAWVVMKWAGLPEWQKPRIITLENVTEFETWGPLTKKNYPNKRKIGQTFRLWCSQLEALGYAVDFRPMVAADYGAPTIRKRLFIVARCDGFPITWPDPTHSDPRLDSMGFKKPWRSAASIIDFSLNCPSIFERKRPLAENTQKRIAAGLRKFVIDHPDPFMIQTGYGERAGQKPRVLDKKLPLGTIVSGGKHAVVTPFVDQAYGTSTGMAIDRPLGTQTQKEKASLVLPFLDRQFGTARGNSVENPLGTVMAHGAGGKTGLVAPFIQHVQHSSNPSGVMDAAQPLRTITATPKGGGMAMVSAFMAQHNTGVVGRDIRDPLATVTSRGTQINLCEVDHGGRNDHSEAVYALYMKYYGNDSAHDLREALHTVTTKDRFALVTAKGWPIRDIGLRMLAPRELYNAQGFPPDYKIDMLTKTQQVTKCGNSVSPPPFRALLKSNVWMYLDADFVNGRWRVEKARAAR